ncbi:alcohol dehydrogenase catalytic domain-containing protein [Agrococcus jejuensis]|uniref:alcohol dehydrogenase catalytic domain-containing protein n=1 Tax=Agrococcus jejuensis TaxID=399736 RepID=UPI0011A30399|nr:alcohol dehydrogenase catalytic domain-containing protein [Agrococcus jejuensis]
MTTTSIRGAVLHEIGAEQPYAESRPLRVETLELAGPGATEVLVRIECAGLCHSDLSVVDGNRARPVPMLLGHEAAGIVEEVGGSVPALAVGDRVVMTFLPRCGECRGCASNGASPCERGSASNAAGTLLSGERRLTMAGEPIHHHLGVSGFATHAVVDHRSVVRVDADVPADVASLLGCAVLTGGGAVLNAARPEPGSTIGIVGLGGVGMAAVLVALGVPDVRVVAIDPVPEKRALAERLGARSATADELADAGERFATVVEAAGAIPALEAAVALTAPGGRTVTVGLPHPDARLSLSPTALVGEGRALVGSYLGSAVPSRDIPLYAQMWREGRLDVDVLVSSRIGLDDVAAGMDALASGAALRQIVELD